MSSTGLSLWQSWLGKVRIVKSLPREKVEITKCVKCGRKDPFCYTGTVILGVHKGRFQTEEVSPIKVSGILESYDRSYPIIVGGEVEKVSKGYRRLEKVRGSICCECASDYSTIEFGGKDIPVVQVDSLIIGKSLPVERREEIETRSVKSSSASSRMKSLSSPSQDNQWLNVGRRRK